MSRFERLAKRVDARGNARALKRRADLAARIEEAAPKGVAVAIEGEQVVLSGRGLGRRVQTEPELRWLVAENVHD
ncbi:MAG TPA: hypothetical protein VGB54_08285 [Allosphingosinicella sp.]|jgi:hypothetical protein